MRFPTDGPDWTLSDEQMTAFRETYPSLNVERECQKAMLWLTVNPSRRKTAKGMPRFLVNWLNRADKEKRLRPNDPRVLPPPSAYRWDCPHSPHCGNRAACQIVAMRTR